MERDQEVTVDLQNPSWKSLEAPPGGCMIMITSYTASNKTSLSRKPCIADKKDTMDHYHEVLVA